MASSLKIKQTENQGLKRAFEIVVPAANLDSEIGKQLQQVGQRAKIPGFRPGKVPEKVLRQKYGASVMGDVIQNAVNEATREVLEGNKLTPALQPDVKITEYQEGGDLSFSMAFELMPQSPEVDLGKITIGKPVHTPEDAEIDQALQRIAASNRKASDKGKNAKAENGDIVVIDFKGFLGDEAFEGGEATNFSLELGSGQFIPGFEEQLLGSVAGDEVAVKVPFPKDYHKDDLAGKMARFDVKIHQVQQTEAPTVDDGFAESIGMASLDKLKEAVREQIQSDYNALARNRMKKDLFDQLEKHCDFDVPAGMLKLEFDSIWQQVGEAKKQGDPAVKDKPEAELRAEYEAIALRRVRLGIFLSQTAGRNSLTVDREDLQRAVMEQARQYPGQQRQIFEFYNKHPEQLSELRGPILEEKAVDFILGKIELKEARVSLDDLIAEQQSTDHTHGAAHVPDADHGHVHDEHCNHDHEPAHEAKAPKKAKAKKAE